MIQTLRHLVFVVDAWLSRAVLGAPMPYHPAGLVPEFMDGAGEMGIDTDRVADVRRHGRALARTEPAGHGFLATATADDLDRECEPNDGPLWPPIEPGTTAAALPPCRPQRDLGAPPVRASATSIPSTAPRTTVGSVGRVTRVLSCMQPTGELHLGNYLGAFRNWVKGQHEKDVFHGIVDLHSLTIAEEPGVVANRTMELAAIFFGVGLDPDVATIFVQSHVPEHAQLAWLMECNVSYGELSRMTQFKDKSAKREGEFISGGLFTYPALMAADILLYDTDEVPGRRRPAPARRDHPRHRRAVQPALRRDVRHPRGRDPAGRRPDHGPAGPDLEDVEVGELATPARSACSTSPT